MSITEGPMTVLDSAACWEHLATQKFGRLVTNVGNLVDIVPINFVVDGESIVFRTASGSKLAGLTVNNSVVFEADQVGQDQGWSVVLHGRARALDTEEEVAEAEKLGLRTFVPTLKPTYVRVEVESLTGRKYQFGEEPRREDVQHG